MRWSRVIPLAGVTVAAGAAAAFVVGMRRKSPVLQDRIRHVGKAYAGPLALRTAGLPGRANGYVRHVGRVSGRTYVTPVTPHPVADGFVIALPYTSKVDWAQNVLAAGGATIVHDGEEHPVVDARIVTYDEVRPLLPTAHRTVRAVLDLQEYLRVTSVEE